MLESLNKGGLFSWTAQHREKKEVLDYNFLTPDTFYLRIHLPGRCIVIGEAN